MSIAGLVLIALAGVVHVGIFLIESVLWRSKSTWRTFGIRDEATAEAARPWAFNQGFYNLFLAVGAIGGAIVAIAARPAAGVLVLTGEQFAAYVATTGVAAVALGVAAFSAACMVGAAIVLRASSGAGSTRSAAIQGGLPLIGLLLLGLSAALQLP